MPMKSFVVRSSPDGWMVQREGKKSPVSTHKKKDVAVRKGRSLAKRAHRSEERRVGKECVQAKRSYAA